MKPRVEGERDCSAIPAVKLPAEALEAMAGGLARTLECYVSITECEEEAEEFLAALRRHGWLVSPPSAEPRNLEKKDNRTYSQNILPAPAG